MLVLFIGLLILAALALGIVGNRWWARRDDAAEEGLGINDLVTPLTTLAVVLLAFIMVEAIASYGRARDDIGTEARVLNEMGDSATRVQDRSIATALQQDLVCYARAVRSKEWTAMTSGHRAPEVGVWTGDLRAQLDTLVAAGGGDVTNRLIDLDGRRSELRLARIIEASPTIPAGLNWLMYVSVILSVFGLGFFLRSKDNRTVYIAVLVVFTMLLAGTLYMIRDLDSPFSGVNKLRPTEMTRIQMSLEVSYAKYAPSTPFPCNADGVKA